MSKNTILGLDIGYSNLKICHGDASQTDQPQAILRPSGAAPSDRFGGRFDGKAQEDFLRVLVGEEEFVAGVSPDRAEMWARSLHHDYPTTPSYQALFKAALLLAGEPQIDVLVTGLPVSQFYDQGRRAELVRRMEGVHQITPKIQVAVKQVRVIAQPVGGLLDFMAQTEDPVGMEEARILVIDPGFFSVDWVVCSQSELLRQSSGTSTKASSVVLEEAARLMASDYGTQLNTEILENAIRRGRETVMVFGQNVNIAEYVQKANCTVAPIVVETIKKALRDQSKEPDVVVMVGGGSVFFTEAVKAVFSRQRVMELKDPVFSNARGFWYMGAAQ